MVLRSRRASRSISRPLFATLALLLLALPTVANAADPGDLDPSFGVSGNVIVDLGGSDLVYAVGVDSLERVIVAGQSRDVSTNATDAVVIRLLPDGSLDPAFGSGGIARVSVGPVDFAYALRIAPDDKVVVGGQTSSSPTGAGGDLLVFRLNTDGTLDSSFGTNGLVTQDFGGGEFVSDLALESDGKVLVVSGTRVLRYQSDGALDPTFGVGGIATLGFGANSVEARPSGEIVIGTQTQQEFIAWQLESDGSIDQLFGVGGSGAVSFDAPSSLRDMTLQPDGKIVLSGSVTPNPFNIDFALARIDVDGSPDASFGVGGAVQTDIGVGDFANGLGIQADGKIVAAGTVATAFTGRSDIGVARYMPDGSLDASFGVGGTTLTDFGKLEFPWKTAIQADGKIVVAGSSTSNPGRADANYQVVRYLATGDVAPPHVTGIPDRAPNAFGWYDAPVVIDWQATDDSGSATDPPDTVASTEGADVTYTSDPSCDPSGNCATGSVVLSIDETPPAVESAVLSATVISASAITSLAVTATDNLSGVAGGEFFIGADPGAGLGTPLTDHGGTLTATVGSGLSADIYVVGTRVQDLAGNWSTVVTRELVVFDPAAGFITGGGWFVSPPGALTAGPEATGKANFGFSAKYKKRNQELKGQLQFRFRPGDFRFHTTSLEWLVVADDGTAVLKALGRVNGEGPYEAQIWIEDDPDRIRVKIWTTDSAGTETVVYDTGELLDLGGGQLKIHRRR